MKIYKVSFYYTDKDGMRRCFTSDTLFSNKKAATNFAEEFLKDYLQDGTNKTYVIQEQTVLKYW